MRGPVSVVSRLALWAIRRYQRHLSPIKGYSCALRAATGADSCSAYGYRVIARQGLLRGLPLLRRRLRRCATAWRTAAAPRNPLLHHQRGDCDSLPCDACNGCDLPSPRTLGRCLGSGSGDCACGLADLVAGLFDCGKEERRRRRQERSREPRQARG